MTASLHFTDELNQIDFEHVTQWLSASYWSPGISQAIVEKGAHHSTVVVGVFIDGKQVAYGRAISDTTRFAYVADVIVDGAFRQQGIATALMNYLIHHPKLDQVEHWYLITKDAMAVYEPLGFNRFNHPERTVMVMHR